MADSSLIWKRRVGSAIGWMTQSPIRRVILLYHSVGSMPWAVSPGKFAEQVEWLRQHAQVVPLDVLLKDDTQRGLRVAITFDDGYRNVFDEAAPILRHAGMVSTVYVNPSLVSDLTRQHSDARLGHYPNESFMLWSELAKLHADGWTIGSHGEEHVDLTRQTPAELHRQVNHSRRHLRDRLGGPCEHYCYAWGRFNALAQRTVREAGYVTAAGGIHGPLRSDSDRHALPRIDVRAEYEIDDFGAIVSGRWDYLGWVQKWRAGQL